MSSPEPFRVLLVCTGNICRSAAGEQLLQHLVDPEAAVVVASAGTRAVVGSDIEPDTALAVSELLPIVRPHVARQLEPDMVRNADVVLGLTREHRSVAVQLAPAAVNRAYTLLELTRLVSSLPAADLASQGPREVLQLARNQRGVVRAASPADDDIGDPYGQPLAVHRQVVAQINDACQVLAAAFGGRAGLYDL